VYLFTALQAVAGLVLLSLAGFIPARAKLISQESLASLSRLLTTILLPCLVFSTFTSKKGSTELYINLIVCLGLSFALLIISALAAALILKRKKDGPTKRVLLSEGIICNSAFIGIPILEAVFPGQSEPVMYVLVFGIAINAIGYSWMTYILSGDKKFMSVRMAIFNIPNIALYITLPFFITGFKLPAVITHPIELVGNTVVPLSMVIIGAQLGFSRFSELFKSKGVYLITVFKLIICPLLGLAIVLPLRMVGLNRLLALTLFIIMAMPCGTLPSMFAEIYHSDAASGARCVLLSTLLSVVSIPLFMLLTTLLH
jgi:predicted permease